MQGEVADARRAGKIDAELLDDTPLHFGNGHLQHHLFLAFDAEHVEDVFLLDANVTGSKILSLARLARAGDHARQDDVVVERLDIDPGGREVLTERVAQAAQIAGHANFQIKYLLPAVVEEESVGLPHRKANQIGPLVGAHHCIDDRRVGHQDVAGGHGQLHDRGLVESEHDASRDLPYAALIDLDEPRVAGMRGAPGWNHGQRDRVEARDRSHFQFVPHPVHARFLAYFTRTDCAAP